MLPSRVPVLRKIGRDVAAAFSPAELFAGGAQGAWYDTSSLWGAADHLPRRNLLTSTATLATQTKTVTAVSHTLYIKGTGSVTLSGAATGTLNGTGASNRVSLVFTPTAGSLTLTVSGTVTEGHLTTTATTDHSYQSVTDWTTELYAWAAQKNVPWLKRNVATYSETFSNAYWATKTSVTATANTITETATSNRHLIASTAFTAPITCRVLFRLRKNTNVRYVAVGLYSTTALNCGCGVDLDTGTITGTGNTGNASASSATISDLGGGVYEVGVTCTISDATTAGAAVVLRSTSYSSGAINETYLGSTSNTLDILAGQITVGATITEYQPVLSTWEAQFAANAAAAGVPLTMYTDSAGTTPVTGPDSVIGKLNDLSGGGYHAVQSGATGLKPTLRLSPNGYWYIQRDLSDDALVTTFPNLGTNCVSYINDGSTVTETTGITLNGALTQSTPAADYGRIYLNAPSSKSAQIIKWLKAKAGLA